MTETEIRMSLVPLEELLAERDDLVQQVARLRARHGSFGTWDAERKLKLAQLSAVVRAQAALEGKKITEAGIEESAHAHPEYAGFIADAVSEKADWILLENRIAGIQDTIQRGNVVGRYLALETTLVR
jgi:chorismate mutase